MYQEQWESEEERQRTVDALKRGIDKLTGVVIATLDETGQTDEAEPSLAAIGGTDAVTNLVRGSLSTFAEEAPGALLHILVGMREGIDDILGEVQGDTEEEE